MVAVGTEVDHHAEHVLWYSQLAVAIDDHQRLLVPQHRSQKFLQRLALLHTQQGVCQWDVAANLGWPRHCRVDMSYDDPSWRLSLSHCEALP
jgi:hypothetical protein